MLCKCSGNVLIGLVALVRMGGERGDLGAKPPGLGHGVQGWSGGLFSRFRPWRTKGGPGGLPPRFRPQRTKGFRPQRLELTHFVTGSVMFFVVFHAFRNLYTPPKTPFFPTGPASLLVVIRGFPPHIIDTRA